VNDTPKAGHNSKAQILAFVDRLCRLQEEKAAFEQDIRDLKTEAKGVGVDPRTVVAIAKLKKQGKDEAKAARELYDTYLATLDWLD
jgi:uncharacterized protein (UPF0335 family)